ncbi:MAG: universal stress protein [Pseudomonadota bacterium]
MFNAILLPLDIGADDNQRLLEQATTLAKANAATLHLLTVVPDFGLSIVGSFFPENYERAALDEAKAKLDPLAERARTEGVVVEAHVGHGSVYDQILRVAAHLRCDLIVIGAHRPELRDYLLGPNAARVVRHANQSVLVLRES